MELLIKIVVVIISIIGIGILEALSTDGHTD